MKIMDYFRRFPIWRMGCYYLFALLTIAAIGLLIAGSVMDNGQAPGKNPTKDLAIMILCIAFLTGFFAILLSMRESVKSVKESGDKMDNVADMINRNNNLLSQIAQSSRLSDAAKQLAFRPRPSSPSCISTSSTPPPP
jgi:hypothetical protein